MYKNRQSVKTVGILLTVLVALTGCSQLENGGIASLLPGQPAGETLSSSRIVIEVVDRSHEEESSETGETESAAKDDDTGELPGWESKTQETPDETIEKKRETGQEVLDQWNGASDYDFSVLSPAHVYPGEALDEEEVFAVGVDEFFTMSAVDGSLLSRMYGNSYKSECPVPRTELRYLRLLHWDFYGNIRVGEMVCHQSISEDLMRIFRQLYDAGYPIEKMVLVDDYSADDDLSSADNNTSCFNYRTVSGGSQMSLHARGVAVDVNPLYNPYVTRNAQGEVRCAPSNGIAYIDRTKDFPYKIDENDLCYKLFTEAGFTWGGSWSGNPDYMHFSRTSARE